ncbi:MAG: TIGR02281 family clan AA aspartic protease [Candidatus Thiodiazotropha taylori]|uniref:TIGR02281 family clan AA aspartic protease n=1 Tax=Candidatus Thiodiazotropha taylori TaxID=2792791 RepID=A0A9E4P2M8_9GAMM|nr:TIGR02281 family clan AA aspartic protease [Candidatus Thiodiazotropha taylori]MCG7933444.1 TIGR02281 family clan AA aspartic protease [Candidatus Thiodiazotropha taylori]MCG7944484.1 TIGR02281 family clan AA aspartic protease [Candidatus Thiodiazotropha taylori]MCG7947167.1 TIGR02281 family clan AA aspartic protease [Candidatus Thiodiazotropha taylori]MCG7955884.1 TIGR02281 family clan AA aspartic protease [Candidatus Thiodiazotropha taylori]
MSEQQNFGRWMIIAAWVLMLAMLTLLFSQWLERQNNPNRQLSVTTNLQGESSVVLKRNRAGHYVAPGKINGVDVVYLLDTGATLVAVSSSLAEKAGLQPGTPSQSRTANGVVRSWLTEIDRLQLGPITMQNVKASILPTMPAHEVLLGMSFLKHLKLQQQGDELEISLPD